MVDRSLEAYVEAIEAHLARRRGRLVVLAPPDFALARRWHAAGIPLERVTGGIDDVVAAGHSPGSLRYCRHAVEAGAGQPDSRKRGAAPEAGVERAGEARGGLLLAAIDALPPQARAHFASLRPALPQASTADDATLARLDAAVDEAALAALAAPERARHEADAARAVQRLRGRVSGAALAEAKRRQLLRRARESLGLPHLTD